MVVHLLIRSFKYIIRKWWARIIPSFFVQAKLPARRVRHTHWHYKHANIFIHIYVLYINIYTYICTCIRTCVYTYIYVCICTSKYIFINRCTPATSATHSLWGYSSFHITDSGYPRKKNKFKFRFTPAESATHSLSFAYDILATLHRLKCCRTLSRGQWAREGPPCVKNW